MEVFENNNSKRLGEYEFTKAVNGHQVSYNELKENGYDVKHDWIDPILETVFPGKNFNELGFGVISV